MLKYNSQIQELTVQMGFPVMGEAFEGHPDDPTILEEYYLWDCPKGRTPWFKKAIAQIVEEPWELNSNVLTIYKGWE